MKFLKGVGGGLILVLGFLFLASNAQEKAKEKPDHSLFMKGQVFEKGEDVTMRCISCHNKQAEDILKTAHWRWQVSIEGVVGLGTKTELGKKNLFNNYCVAITSNWKRCTVCHIGYGWEDETFDFSDKTKIDCLLPI